MKISEIIKGKKTFPSLEIVPPLKGVTKTELLESIRPFMEFNPPFINVTSHRDEYEFIPNPDGSFTRKAVKRRISETAVCAAIRSEFDVEPVPHIICAGAGKEKIEGQLSDLKFLGIDNLMALRGDCALGQKRFTPEEGGYSHASELVSGIKEFESCNGASFCVGVGGYPEKHFEAPNFEMDLDFLKAKVDAGADFIITQMFFDNKVFYSFRDRCRAKGINAPIIPGLKPLSSLKQLELIPQTFSVEIPLELAKGLKGSDPYSFGEEWCSSQVEDLLKHDVPAVHFYTMGKPRNVIDILRKNF